MLDAFKKDRKLYIVTFVIYLAVLTGLVLVLRRPEPRVITIITPTPRPTATIVRIQVQVSGAINQPGVYTLPANARLADALESAGGTRPEADLSRLNLARKLKDGEAVTVPVLVTTPTRTAPTLTPEVRRTAASTPTRPAPVRPSLTAVLKGKIDINTASVEELDRLPRIGPVLAQRIVDYRTQNGPFQQIEDIKLVKGIGDSLFDSIKDLITVGGP